MNFHHAASAADLRVGPLAESSSAVRVCDVITCATLVIALLIRFALLTGASGSDDIAYFHFAQKLLHGQPFTELDHRGGRLAFLALIGVPGVLFGSIYAGAVVNVVILSLRDIVVVAYARKRFGGVAAASAAGILGFNAVSAAYAGLLQPDGLLSLTLFMTTALVFEAMSAPGSRRVLMLAGAGLLAGVGYSAKDTGILIVPCAVAWIVAGDSRWKMKTLRQQLQDAAVFCGGFAAFALFEMGVDQLLTGDALYRLHAISFAHNTNGDVTEAKSIHDFLRMTYWNAYSVSRWEAGSTPVLLLALLIWPLVLLLRGRSAFFALTGGFVTIYLVFGSSSFTRLIPLPVQDRYFEVIVPLLAIATADVVAHAGRAWPGARHIWVAAAIPVMLALASLPSIVVNAGDVAFSGLAKNASIAVKGVRQANEPLPVYASPRMRRVLEPFLPPEVWSDIRLIPESGPLAPGYYILNPLRDTFATYGRAKDIAPLPTYIVVDEDFRKLGRFAPKRQDRKVVVKFLPQPSGG
jgi:hypothetical protein